MKRSTCRDHKDDQSSTGHMSRLMMPAVPNYDYGEKVTRYYIADAEFTAIIEQADLRCIDESAVG